MITLLDKATKGTIELKDNMLAFAIHDGVLWQLINSRNGFRWHCVNVPYVFQNSSYASFSDAINQMYKIADVYIVDANDFAQDIRELLTG